MLRQRGVALAMLLWFVAAMLLLVGGLVALARLDVSLAQWQAQSAQAAAAGDGATRLLLRDLLYAQTQGEYPGRGIFARTYIIGEKTVNVRAVPAGGLLSLNAAREPLLTDLFRIAAGLDDAHAELLAQRVIVWRSSGSEDALDTDEYLAAGLPYGPRHDRFRETEDLLQVLGVTREIYQRVADLVYAQDSGGRGIDLLSAPGPVLTLLAGGDAELALAVQLEREQDPFVDMPIAAGLLEEHLSSDGSLRGLRVDARVLMPDGKVLRRRSWVNVQQRGSDLLPWRIARAEPVQRVKSAEFIAHGEGYGD